MCRYESALELYDQYVDLIDEYQKPLAFLREKTEFGANVLDKESLCESLIESTDFECVLLDLELLTNEINAEKTNTGHTLTKEEKDLTRELIHYGEIAASEAMNAFSQKEHDEMMREADAAIYPSPC
ncbi:MAG: hypothetical protein E6234_06150 [Sutterella wadsworthensis]|nr:hypothetical protein [Sutterella wadsworthensis]